METAIVLLIAWILDLILGDPSWLPHPIVAFGRWISLWEKRLNRGKGRWIKGSVFALMSLLLALAVPYLLLREVRETSIGLGLVIHGLSVPNIIIESILLFFCLAGKTLRREVRDVFLAVDRGLDEGRHQVARIVGRDTQNLSAQEIRTAALETLAENLSDGVIAPLFWFLLLGVPGALMYKMGNTMDSMIGYKTERYKDYGCAAARLDDLLNWIPSRLTALLMVISSGKDIPSRAGFVLRFGPCHASPNSGWPESALASILDCRFGGTHDYFGQTFEKPYIGTRDKVLATEDMDIAISINMRAEVISVIMTAILLAL